MTEFFCDINCVLLESESQLFGAGVYCLFAAAVVVRVPVDENGFADRNVLALGLILQIQLNF